VGYCLTPSRELAYQGDYTLCR